MEKMVFSSYKADLDVWFHPALKSNRVENYQCAILCAEEMLATMEEPEIFLRDELRRRLTLKEKSIGSPE